MTVWGWIGFGALIFLAGLQSVPQDVLEAAQTDGCSGTKAFWLIQVPLLRPVIGFMLVWLTINALPLFDEVYVTTKGGPLHATTVVVYYLYQQAFVLLPRRVRRGHRLPAVRRHHRHQGDPDAGQPGPQPDQAN
jgi:multiple sugar transport system permease protein